MQAGSSPGIAQQSPAAFVLHTWPWRESSLVVELLTAPHGRVAAIAKGARRPHSPVRGMLQPFLPLTLRLSGKSDVKTLGKVEPQAPFYGLPPERLSAGFYLNELILALLPRDLPDEGVFDAYCACLVELREGRSEPAALRHFEKRLLQASGNAPPFDQTDTGPVDANATYLLVEGQGWVQSPDDSGHATDAFQVHGSTLLAISQERFDGAFSMQGNGKNERLAIKRVMQHLLARLSPVAGARSRKVSKEIAALAARHAQAPGYEAAR
jgi:DNA repair protein RecO (recombination protein O)